MRTLLIGLTTEWENCLRNELLRRGHSVSAVHEIRPDAVWANADCELAFVRMDGTGAMTSDVCRRLRDCRAGRPIEIVICGAVAGRKEMDALVSTGADDYLSDPQDLAELELRLALAESRVMRCAVSHTMQQPGTVLSHQDHFLDKAPKGFFRSSLDGRLLEVDQCFVDMLGYESRDEAMRIDIVRDFYVDPSMRRRLLTELSTESTTHEFFCKRKDGEPMPVRCVVRRIFDDAGNFVCFAGTIQDVSASAGDQSLLKMKADLALKLSGTSDLQATLDAVLASAMQIEGLDCGAVYLLNDSSEYFELAAAVGLPERLLELFPRCALEEPQMQSVMRGKPLYLRIDEVSPSTRPHIEQAGMISGVIAPITHQGHVIGTLNLASYTRDEILLSSRPAIEAIASQIGGSVARAQVESARYRAQQNLQSLFDTLKDMIFVLDQSGRVLYANHAVGARLGYTQAELLEMHVSAIHPPERYQEAIEVFSGIVTGASSLCEIPLVASDGTQIPVETVTAHGKWGKIDAVFGIARDLSETHRARLALHESESRFRAIFESAAVGLTLVDLQGTILVVNATFAKMLGYKPEELVGKKNAQFALAHDIDDHKVLLEELCSQRRDKIVKEKQYVHKSGDIIWGRLNVSLVRDAQDAPLYCIGIIENITDHKRAVDRLRENEAFLRSLFDNLPDHVFVVDRNARIVFANRDATGLSKENVIGEEGFSFIAAAYKEPCRGAFAHALSTHNVQRVECLDVYGRFWSCAVVPLIYHDAVQRVMVICTDTTEQRQAAAAIEEEQRLLRKVIDLQERDRQATAYEIHDGVTQQLAASLLHLDAFRRLREGDAGAAEKSLDTASRLLSQSVNETRRLISGLRPLILDEYGIVEAIDYLVSENRERSGIRIDVRHDVRFKRLAAPLESAAFRIVQEALANACRHSQSDTIIIELSHSDDRLYIRVQDHGVGFDPGGVQESCFGLRGIRERARLLGGQAEVLSAPGSGTVIQVELPMVLQADAQTQ
jgi:PAS domain S-box-containing protein